MLTPRLAAAFAIALAACLVAARADAQDPESEGDLRRPERLTVGVADDLLGQLSPDGKTLYFVSNRKTTNQIYAQNMSDGRAKLFFDDDADVTWPRVSPDGQWLLYVSFGAHATGDLCIRHLPDGEGRRCLDDGTAALQAEWIDSRRIALVSRRSVDGDLRLLEVTVAGALSARPLVERNLTSPAISPDGRWIVYVPVERTVEGVGPAFAARAAPKLEATRLGSGGAPLPIELDLPGRTGQPVFARDGRSLYIVQFFSDTNHDGVTDANDHGVLFRVPISFTGDTPAAGPPEQLTETSWNCEYPSPAADRLVATCSQDQSLEVYSLPLDGEVPPDWTTAELTVAIATAASRVEQQLLSSRRLRLETTTSGRRVAMLDLAMLHLGLEQFRAAEFYADEVSQLRDHATAGISRALRTLVEHRHAAHDREQGRTLEGFKAAAKQRLEELHPKPTWSPIAVALAHVVRSEISDSIGDKTQARSELEATILDDSVPAPIVEAYYQRADTLYRNLDDREALVSSCKALSENAVLSPDDQLRYARAAVRAMTRGLAFDEADARLARERTAAHDDSELAFALDGARAVLAIRDDHPSNAVGAELLALYTRQTRAERRDALVADAVRRATELGAMGQVEALAQKHVETVRRGTRERRGAERLYSRVMTNRAYRLVGERRFAEARVDFDAIAEQTGSYEALVGAIDMRLKVGERPDAVAAAYEGKGVALPRSRFAKAYVLARGLTKLEGDEHAKAAAEAIATLRASWSELKSKRIAQALDGALFHEEYLRTGDLGSAEKANLHYLVALELVKNNPRFRAMILGQLGILHAQVGNFRIALGYLLDRDKLPYADNAEGLAVHLAKARALLHVGRDDDAATTADEAVAMIERNPGLARYRVLALDRAAVDNLAAGRFSRALALYDQEVPALDAAPGPSSERNRFVARIARAAAAVGAEHPDLALRDLAEVAPRLADPKLVSELRWPRASDEDVQSTYRLIVTGVRAKANLELGRFDAESRDIAERRAILQADFARSARPEVEHAVMLAEAQLAANAGDRHDTGAAASWLGQVIRRADDLRARANGAVDKDQLEVVRLAAELTIAAGVPLVRDLPRRLRSVSADVAAHPDAVTRAYERWFEIYLPLTSPQAPEPAPVADTN